MLKTDIRRVLTHGETAFEADRKSLEDEVSQERNYSKIPNEIDVNEMVDESEKDKLVSEFKRVVLPAVHPDTSDTPDEIFTNIFEVYDNLDYVLMETYTVQYRGEIVPDQEEDQVVFLEEACEYHNGCEKLLGKLKRRVEHLMKELTPQEMEDPEKY